MQDAADPVADTPLAKLGLTLDDTPGALMTAVKPKLSATGKFDDVCDKIGVGFVEEHGVFTIGQMGIVSADGWRSVFENAGGKASWIPVFENLIGATLARPKAMCPSKSNDSRGKGGVMSSRYDAADGMSMQCVGS